MRPDQQAEQWLKECLYVAGLDESKVGVMLRKKPSEGAFSVVCQQQEPLAEAELLARTTAWLCHHWLQHARQCYLLAVHSGDISATGSQQTLPFAQNPTFNSPLLGHSATLLRGENGRSLARKPLASAETYLLALLKLVWIDLTGYVPVYAQERIILPLETFAVWLDRLAGFSHQPDDCRKIASLAMHPIGGSPLVCDPFAGAGSMLVSAAHEHILALQKAGSLVDFAGKPLKNILLSLSGQRICAEDKWGNPLPYLAQAGPGGYARKIISEAQMAQEAIFRIKKLFYTQQAFAVVAHLAQVPLLRFRWQLDLLANLPYRQELALERPHDLPERFQIRVANSFISRFALGASLPEMLDNQVARVGLYTSALRSYLRETDPTRKAEAGDMILDMQRNFRPVMRPNPADLQRLQLLRAERNDKSNPLLELSLSPAQRSQRDERIEEMDKEIAQLEAQLQPESWFYTDAMEWRFDFPEALVASTGDFRGFGAVITQHNDDLFDQLLPPHTYLSSRFGGYAYFAKSYLYATELCYQLTHPGGAAIVLLPIGWQESATARAFRAWLSRIPVQIITVEGKTLLKLIK